MNVLVLKSSILADNSQSNKLADYTIEKLKDHNIVAVSYTHLDVYKRQRSSFPCLCNGKNAGRRNACFRLRGGSH